MKYRWRVTPRRAYARLSWFWEAEWLGNLDGKPAWMTVTRAWAHSRSGGKRLALEAIERHKRGLAGVPEPEEPWTEVE
jgi:hypothetical protein